MFMLKYNFAFKSEHHAPAKSRREFEPIVYSNLQPNFDFCNELLSIADGRIAAKLSPAKHTGAPSRQQRPGFPPPRVTVTI